MELRGRLKLISDKIPMCGTLCDIGTDHAYIPIFSVEERICDRAIASDVRMGPIEIARENIRASGFENKIEARLGNGLEPIGESEADVIVIAGMGGVLICDILSEGINKAQAASTVILQPMNAIEIVREWLCTNGFEIFDEELTNEGEKIYNVIVCRWTGIKISEPEIYYHVGRILIQKKDPLLKIFLQKKLRQIEAVLKEMENIKDEGADAGAKYKYLRDKYLNILKDC